MIYRIKLKSLAGWYENNIKKNIINVAFIGVSWFSFFIEKTAIIRQD